MQRVFLAIAPAGLNGIAFEDIESQLPFDAATIRLAIRRLRECKGFGVIDGTDDEPERYFVLPGTRMPSDDRGRPTGIATRRRDTPREG